MNVIITAITAILLTLLSLVLISGFWGMVVVIIFVVVFNIIEPLKRHNGLIVAGLCGFLWDLYSPINTYFGFHLVGLLLTSLVIRQVVKRVIQVPESS
ncbi:MAG: hypothetical protein V1905_00545 [bacterium]